MVKARSQNDIVHNFLRQNERGTEVTDRVEIPGIREVFIGPTPSAKIKTDTVTVSDLKDCSHMSRRDIAEILLDSIGCKPGVVGLDWRVGEDQIYVSYVEGFKQREIETDYEELRIIDLLTMVLKLKKDITQFRWSFGDTAIEVKYILP